MKIKTKVRGGPRYCGTGGVSIPCLTMYDCQELPAY